MIELLGPTIRRIRKQQGKPLREIARLAESSVSYLSDIERGRTYPSLKVLYKISTALGYALSALIGECECPPVTGWQGLTHDEDGHLIHPIEIPVDGPGKGWITECPPSYPIKEAKIEVREGGLVCITHPPGWEPLSKHYNVKWDFVGFTHIGGDEDNERI